MHLKHHSILVFLIFLIIWNICVPLLTLHAQITLDGSTGPPGELPGPHYTIDADIGKQAGGNLFHSFDQFNIKTGESATFTGPDSVSNIISRVTGESGSWIDGPLRSEIPGADFYLLNPRGLMFGPNALLDISGSFHLSTADYLRLGHNGRFDALLPENSLLSSAPPAAFGFLDENPGALEIRGSLTVPPDHEVSLTGGDMEISGGIVSAPGGEIRIFSTASEGEVNLQNVSDSDFSSFRELGEISVSDGAMLEVGGMSAGEIDIRGGRFYLSTESSLSAITGESEGRGIDIRMRESLVISQGASVFTASLGGGRGGDISVSAGSFFLDNGLIFSESGFLIPSDDGGDVSLIGGKGDGGNIRLNADSADISGGMISTNTLDSGKAGDISISGETLNIRDGAKIVADNGNVYTGAEGNIIDGRVIGGKGDSGNITLNVSRLEINSASLSSNTLGSGAGGNLSVTASDWLNIAGSGTDDAGHPADFYHGLSTQTRGGGHGGHISMKTESLNLSQDAMINGQTYGSGRGGDVELDANRLEIHQGGTITTSTRGAGDAGEIVIHSAGSVHVSGAGVRLDKSRIYTATHSGGSGGDLTISADSLTIGRDGEIFAKTLGDDTWDGNTLKDGPGGDIELNTKRLELNNGGLVTAGSESEGDAGNIAVRASDSVTLGNASVRTSTEQADGGDIFLDAENRIHMTDSAVSTSVEGGKGDGGNIAVGQTSAPEFLISENSRIIANARGGNGGNIHIAADQFVRSAGSIVDASSELGIDGETEIESPDTDIGGGLTVLAKNYTDLSKWLGTACADRSGDDISRLSENPRDAAPTSPDDWLASPPRAFESAPGLSGDSRLLRGEALYRGGDFGGAVREWEQGLLSLNPEHDLYLRTLTYLSHGYQALGFHLKALAAFSGVLPVFGKMADPNPGALFFSTLGDIHLSLGNRKAAREHLETALTEARRTDDPHILASVLNNMGNFFAAEKDGQSAMAAYGESLGQTGEPDSRSHLKSETALNMARLVFETGDYEEQYIMRLLEDALGHILRQPDCHDRARNRICLSLLARKVREAPNPDLSPGSEERLRSLVSESLEEAREFAGKAGDSRIASYACGYMGQFLKEENREAEALALTREAVFFAQQRQYCPEILYLWQRQLGKLLASRGDTEAAILSLQNAADTLNPIRTEFFRGYRDGRSVFYEKIKPVYMELAESLLKTGGDESGGRLIRARDTMEILKVAELEDFFQDECLTGSQKSGEFVPPHTAVIYPISLPDRLEILLNLPRGMRRITVPETSADLRRRVRIFHERLTEEYSDRYRTTARKLYEILIRPIEGELLSQDIRTLIVSPDDVLRLVPFSALVNPDDEQFLIEKYAIGTVPGITLTDHEPPGPVADRILLCGLSEGNPPLPRVTEELENIREIMGGGKVLLNQDFTVPRLDDEFENRTYALVHMATHGEFAGLPEETFLATYNDGRITMDDLEKLILTGMLRGVHMELLTFSACQTAAGDERAGLGLAGLTVRAGARSAIATLWSVTDEAASLTITEFYRQFRGGASKAESLQRAQRKCIDSEDYQHPAYWAPFLLIGNWM